MRKNVIYAAIIVIPMVFLSACGNHMGTIDNLPTSFSSNGEKIYFTGVSSSGEAIQPIPAGIVSGHMMGSCASCHGAQRQGGKRMMPFFWVKSAPLTREALVTEEEHDEGHGDHGAYNSDSLAKAIRQGIDPAGEVLNSSMPLWKMSDSDMKDLTEYLLQ